MKLLGLAASVALCCASSALAAVSQIVTCRFAISVSGHMRQVPCEGNQNAADTHQQVLRAVVIVHGSQRNCSEGFKALTRSATLAGLENSTSLLVVPKFLTEEDIDLHGLPAEAAPSVGETGPVAWDGRDGTGERLPAGVDFVRAGDGRTFARVILL